MPAGKPAPPLPVKFEFNNDLIISCLSVFEKISERSLNSKDSSGIKEIADEYHMGVSTIHGAESFYEFLRPAHRAKKAFVCNGSACMCSGTQEPLKKKLK
ncbi:hypothetical protein OAR45_04070, partial [Candidatus Pelagibacter sp.]|nr:hypothetical protein [Candidatus Pelagibacter sp.]